MGTVILLNLANFAHWIAFPAIAKKAAAYYDVSGWIALVKTKVKIEDVMNVEKKTNLRGGTGPDSNSELRSRGAHLSDSHLSY